jgi:hypothetical protein
MFEIWSFSGAWCLELGVWIPEFGVWDFIVIWDLAFGILPSAFP